MEHCLHKQLLDSETVCVIKLNVYSQEVGNLSMLQFKAFRNRRKEIEHEIGKLINVNTKSIELLRPIQLKNGCRLSFHIRSKLSQTNDIIKIMRQEADSGFLARAFVKVWKRFGIRKMPQIGGIETKLINSAENIAENDQLVATIAIDTKLYVCSLFMLVCFVLNVLILFWHFLEFILFELICFVLCCIALHFILFYCCVSN